jgi:hypothetical protein
MSAPQEDGGPAFPVAGWESPNHGWIYGDSGMTLRDYFAATALQGWLASWSSESKHPVEVEKAAELVAGNSYAMADAMLAARKEGA